VLHLSAEPGRTQLVRMATHIDVCFGRHRGLPIAIGDRVVRGIDRVDPPNRPWHNHQQRMQMKSYIITTGAVYGSLTVVHVARMFEEGVHLLRDPIFFSTTVAAAGLCAWATILVRKDAHMSRSTK
jgi:hypothetical protein